MLISGLAGLYVASLIGPDSPVYPFPPTENEIGIARYTELAISAIAGFFVLLFVVLTSLALRMPFIAAFFIAVLVGAAYFTLGHLRIGPLDLSQFDLLSILAFVCGLLIILGFLKVIEEFRILWGRSENMGSE